MNRILKYAWYQLIVIIIATLFAAAVIVVMATWWRGKEVNALILLGLFALVHLFKVFYPLKPGEIAFDERDEQIMHRATRHSFIITWYMFALGGLIPVLIIGNGSIHMMYYGWLVFVAAILFRVIWSVSAIIQYGQENTGSKDLKVAEGSIV